MEEVAVLLLGRVGARCGVRVRGSLMGTWVVLCWLLLWCRSAEVVMRRILLPVCLEDGLEGWSWCGCVLWRCGWRYVGRVPFETTGRDEISLFGWRCGRKGLEAWWCIVWMRFGGVFAAGRCGESG